MIIGLTGLNGSGKGVVADYLVSHKDFAYYSLSNVVRDEVIKKDTMITREKLIVTANNLRRDFGPSVLADRVIAQIGRSKNNVVDSFRNPEEVKAFFRISDFSFWSITASEEVRFNRVKLRKREQDPQTLDEFIRIERKELSSDNPAHQNLFACQKLAQKSISNTGTLEELYKKIDSAIG